MRSGTARLWGGMGPPTTCMGGYLNVPHLGDWRERFSMYVVSVASSVRSVGFSVVFVCFVWRRGPQHMFLVSTSA